MNDNDQAYLSPEVPRPIVDLQTTTSWIPGTPSSDSSLFTGSYYGNADLTDLAFTRSHATIDFSWGSGSPDPSLHHDFFSVRWVGSPTFTAGTYQFTAGADDGIRLYIDGTLVIDEWHRAAYSEYTATRTLSAGSHEITVEYFEAIGSARAGLEWDEAP